MRPESVRTADCVRPRTRFSWVAFACNLAGLVGFGFVVLGVTSLLWRRGWW